MTDGWAKCLSLWAWGSLLTRGLAHQTAAAGSPQKPMATIVGGAEVSFKIHSLESGLDGFHQLVIGFIRFNMCS